MLTMGQLMAALRDLHMKVAVATYNAKKSEDYDTAWILAITMLEEVEKELERIRD